MARITLPRYLRARKLASGATAYYWEPPTWSRPPAERHGRQCPVAAEALGTDLAAAIGKADLLNRQFDDWRLGVQGKAAEGTIKALFGWYRQLDRFADLGPRAQRDYRYYMGRLEAFPLKTTALGELRAAELSATHVDMIYRAIASRPAGRRKKGEPERPVAGKRAAAYCMQICRRVWNEAIRHKKLKGPNPFAKMDISLTAQKGNRATTRAEYDAFRAQAHAMGYPSMAAAAALSFELVRRVTDVFGYTFGVPEDQAPTIAWEDYRPGVEIVLRQGKTGDRQEIPLADETGRLLYPVLEEELAKLRPGKGHIVINEDTGTRYDEQRAIKRFYKIRDAAGLPKAMTLTGFRHGGATELGDAGVEDIRPISGHRTLGQTTTYNKVTRTKARKAAAKRLDHVKSGGK